jgi:hypothetical protein
VILICAKSIDTVVGIRAGEGRQLATDKVRKMLAPHLTRRNSSPPAAGFILSRCNADSHCLIVVSRSVRQSTVDASAGGSYFEWSNVIQKAQWS